jgi:lipoprotein-anchoring transpeptidase ErfK/SrfK
MNQRLIEAREYVIEAREALRRGDKNTARGLGEKAVLLVPDLEDAWLILVAAESNPKDALAYARKALKLSPQSSRAHKAVEWARDKLKKAQAVSTLGLTVEAVSIGQMARPVRDVRSEAPVHRPINVVGQEGSEWAEKKSNWRPLVYAGALFGLLICAVIGVAAWSAIKNPALASFLPLENVVPTQELLWAQVDIAKPSIRLIDVSAFAPQTDAAVSTPAVMAEAAILAPTEPPTAIPTDESPTSTPEATETPGVMAMEVMADTPTSAYVPPANAPPVVASGGHGRARWIDVNLSTQSVYAYEGDTVVNSFIVSTGTWIHPTVTGKYKIYMKLSSGNMSGPGYFLPDVPYIMYFYKGYGLHGTYWHNNFGTPMSHGCVNLRTSDAEWLYHWASLGTVVNVHY